MKNNTAICFFITVVSAIIAIISLFKLNEYKSNITEASFSLCGTVLISDLSSEEKAEIVKNYLTFSDLKDAYKEKLVIIVSQDMATEEFSTKLLEFEYSKENIKKIENEIESLSALPVVKVIDDITSEELAKLLIKKVFNGTSKFNVEIGNGINYIRRYYCDNVIIDVCNDEKVRYLSSIEPNGEEDIFMKWLIEEEKATLVSKETVFDMEYIDFSGSTINARLCYNSTDKRVIVAEITIK